MKHNRSVTYGTAIYNIGCVVTPRTKLKRYGLVTKLLSAILEPTLLCGAGARWKFANYVSALPAGSLLDPTNRGHWRGLEGGSGEKGRRKTERLFPNASCLLSYPAMVGGGSFHQFQLFTPLHHPSSQNYQPSPGGVPSQTSGSQVCSPSPKLLGSDYPDLFPLFLQP